MSYLLNTILFSIFVQLSAQKQKYTCLFSNVGKRFFYVQHISKSSSNREIKKLWFDWLVWHIFFGFASWS